MKYEEIFLGIINLWNLHCVHTMVHCEVRFVNSPIDILCHLFNKLNILSPNKTLTLIIIIRIVKLNKKKEILASNHFLCVKANLEKRESKKKP